MSSPSNSLVLTFSRFFQNGDWKEAESLYSQAYVSLLHSYPCCPDPSTISIQKDPANPKIFTNRAITRIKLTSWEACIDDCIKAIELDQSNMKAFYYLAQAQIALNHPNEALSSALTAYGKCLETWSSSTQAVSGLVLQAKKLKWEAKERERIRRRSDIISELEDALMKTKKMELQNLKMQGLEESDEAEEKADIELETRRKIEELRNVFAIADPKNMERRVGNFWGIGLTFVSANADWGSSGGSRLPHRRHIFHGDARPCGDQNGQYL